VAAIAETHAYAAPGDAGSPGVEERYENFIAGAWLSPTNGRYPANGRPSSGEPFCEVASSAPADIEPAVAESHENGKPVRETPAADIPLATTLSPCW
jgi:aldehyde dehydrogenase